MHLPYGLALVMATLAPVASPAWVVSHSETLGSHNGLVILRETCVKGDEQVLMDVARFSSRTHGLRVLDNPDGRHDLRAALAVGGCLAGVNGGYFTPDHTPLGLEICHGKQVHPQERNRLLSGLVTASAGRFSILRVAEYEGARRPAEALQAGPFLVDGGRVVAGLEATRAARRTAIATDGRGLGALLACDALTLAEFARLLATPGLIPGLKITRALNLDGGPSTSFCSKSPAVFRAGNPAVRNYLGLAANRR
jgi:hypothetical protein